MFGGMLGTARLAREHGQVFLFFLSSYPKGDFRGRVTRPRASAQTHPYTELRM